MRLIEVVVYAGDNLLTAVKVARDSGIVAQEDDIMIVKVEDLINTGDLKISYEFANARFHGPVSSHSMIAVILQHQIQITRFLIYKSTENIILSVTKSYIKDIVATSEHFALCFLIVYYKS